MRTIELTEEQLGHLFDVLGYASQEAETQGDATRAQELRTLYEIFTNATKATVTVSND